MGAKEVYGWGSGKGVRMIVWAVVVGGLYEASVGEISGGPPSCRQRYTADGSKNYNDIANDFFPEAKGDYFNYRYMGQAGKRDPSVYVYRGER